MKKAASPQDIYQIKRVEDPQISPDGRFLAYSVTYVYPKSPFYRSQLKIVDLPVSRNILTPQMGRNSSSARWSADSSRFAYLKEIRGSVYLCVFEPCTKKDITVACLKESVSDITWSPDSKQIAFRAFVAEPSIEDDISRAKLKPVKVIDSFVYKFDGVGFLRKGFEALWICEVESGKVRQVATGALDVHDFCWTADSSALVYAQSIPETEAGFHPLVMKLWRQDANSGERIQLLDSRSSVIKPVLAPNGRYLAYLKHDLVFGEASFYKLWIHDLDLGTHRCISNGLDSALGNWGMNDVGYSVILTKIYWDLNSESIVSLISENGSVNPCRIWLDGRVERLSSEAWQITNFSCDSAGRLAALSYTNVTDPGEVVVRDLETGRSVWVSKENTHYRLTTQLLEASETVCSVGEHAVHGWQLVKTGGVSHKPILLYIHGGPHLMYGWSFFLEFQVLAALGFIVHFTNPSGSIGYGQAFADINRGDYGGIDYDDLMAYVDQIQKVSGSSRSPIGVIGGSYGGYMVNWIISQTERFTAAVTERSISNYFSHAGASDDGMFTAILEQKLNLYDFSILDACSPVRFSHKIKTPLLILHSEHDLRCPIDQAEQLYTHLKFFNVPVEMILYPDSSHNLSRTGFPPYRVDRMERIVTWFERYLKGGGSTEEPHYQP